MSDCLGTSEKKRKLEEESSSSEESLSVEAPKGWTTSERKRSKVTDSRCVPNMYIIPAPRFEYAILRISSSWEITSHHFNYISGTHPTAQKTKRKMRIAIMELWLSNSKAFSATMPTTTRNPTNGRRNAFKMSYARSLIIKRIIRILLIEVYNELCVISSRLTCPGLRI